ncbi:MAG: valine--tRNA ligase [Alphaproteobacteria bacterium]|nr:valine--tRNA ligase [Alphaproteobacteria bacterium]
MLDSHFDPQSAEGRLYALWEKSGAFRPNPDPAAPPYCIVIPPPNVTGTLHIGHALNNTLQDVLVRFERMRGKAVLWQPGLDHAGIATQMVVERQLAASGANVDRRSLGRDEFIKRVWAWKGESGGQILNQLKRLGCSADWSRERFTMDEGLSAAVRKVFVQLHRDGLVYKDKRLVNWDPHFETAISDLEVVNQDVTGTMWRIAYPLEDGAGEIVVATTRPETLLGDVAVAVHPEDERYKALIGKSVRLPLTDRLIPIIADDYADPEAGTGAVKITPAHDFNDFKVGKRHNLPMINIFDSRARVIDPAPEPYRGLDRFDARKKVLDDLEALGLRRGEDAIRHTQPFGDRSGVVIEPWLTDQWYVDAPKLAVAATKAVESGETVFTPKQWEKTFFEWMRNIEPWCVSRQLWWGHRISAWYGPAITTQRDDNGGYEAVVDFDGALPLKIFVAETKEEALAQAREAYGQDVGLATDRTAAYSEMAAGQWVDLGSHLPDHSRWGKTIRLWQDEDVLDTWFSSGLWSFSTLGWPDKTPELARFYPTSTLVTGFDIIFFWVARMMMLGIQFMGKAPFKDVYIHALVRDASGAKMSKSKGNVMDPLVLVDKYGADALRFTLAAMAAQGRDIKLSEQRIEGYRNFGTKLWNAARFCQMNECQWFETFDPKDAKETVNRWIIGETAKVAADVTRELEAFRFNEAAGAIYRFVWNVFCDWYLELIKPLLNGDDETAKAETRRTAAWVLDRILVLLHPFMPFVTEELWARLAEFGPKRARMLIAEQWPTIDLALVDDKAAAEIEWIIALVTETRSTRAELNVPPGARIPLLIVGASAAAAHRLERYQDLIDRLARLEYSTSADAAPSGSVTFVVDDCTVALPLDGVVDFAKEVERLGKEIARLKADAAKIDAKLANAEFVRKAPEEVVEEQKERRDDALASVEKLSAALERLQAALQDQAALRD